MSSQLRWLRHSPLYLLSPSSAYRAALSHLQSRVEEQRLSFLPGKIFFVRLGFTATFNAFLFKSKLMW